jgi:hypothetical protein
LISSWNLSSKSWMNFGRVSGKLMLLEVEILNCMLQFFSAYMIIQFEHVVWASHERLFFLCALWQGSLLKEIEEQDMLH